MVAYALGYVYESDTRATGRRSLSLGQVGTRGCDLAGLEVDSENGTGAVGLYERLGSTEARRTTSWTRALPGLAPR